MGLLGKGVSVGSCDVTVVGKGVSVGNGDVTVWDCLERESVWVTVTSRCGTPWEGSPWEPVFALVTLLLPFVHAAVFFISLNS